MAPGRNPNRAAPGGARESILRTFRREFNSVLGALGYRYEESPVCVADGTAPTPDTLDEYIPTARPGHRAPHACLAPGVSTLDLFGRGFTRLAFGSGMAATEEWVAVADRKGVPFQVVPVDDAEAAALYECPFVLVRPDGHVAWRSAAPPGNVDEILAVVSSGMVTGPA
ncbi:aromatic-ring hydroxylase C-terminal domain-containing protein [Streptomyces sp. QTS52]